MRWNNVETKKPKNSDLCWLIIDGEPAIGGWNAAFNAWFDDDDGELEPSHWAAIKYPEEEN